jgi:hypothetical protein
MNNTAKDFNIMIAILNTLTISSIAKVHHGAMNKDKSARGRDGAAFL